MNILRNIPYNNIRDASITISPNGLFISDGRIINCEITDSYTPIMLDGIELKRCRIEFSKYSFSEITRCDIMMNTVIKNSLIKHSPFIDTANISNCTVYAEESYDTTFNDCVLYVDHVENCKVLYSEINMLDVKTSIIKANDKESDYFFCVVNGIYNKCTFNDCDIVDGEYTNCHFESDSIIKKGYFYNCTFDSNVEISTTANIITKE